MVTDGSLSVISNGVLSGSLAQLTECQRNLATVSMATRLLRDQEVDLDFSLDVVSSEIRSQKIDGRPVETTVASLLDL